MKTTNTTANSTANLISDIKSAAATTPREHLSREEIISIAEQVATSLAAIPEEGFRSSRDIREIILHCSATKQGDDFSAGDIRRWHLQRGFNDIGYHFVVRLDGTVERGRDINLTGAHCLNHNRRSIGICYVGGLDRAGTIRRPPSTATGSSPPRLAPASTRRNTARCVPMTRGRLTPAPLAQHEPMTSIISPSSNIDRSMTLALTSLSPRATTP